MLFNTKPDNFNPKYEVVGCYIEFNNKILLLHRHPNKPQGNTWCSPGGKVDFNENNDEAVLREVKEETNILLSKEDIKHFNTFYIKYSEFHFVYHVYKAKLNYNPSIILKTDENVDFKWVTPEEALKMNLIPDEDNCIKSLLINYLNPVNSI